MLLASGHSLMHDESVVEKDCRLFRTFLYNHGKSISHLDYQVLLKQVKDYYALMGRVDFWPFDARWNQIIDGKIYSFHRTQFVNAFGVEFDTTKNGLHFDGVDDYTDYPANPVSAFPEMTAAVWYKPEDQFNWMRIFDFSSSDNNFLFLTIRCSPTTRPALISRTPATIAAGSSDYLYFLGERFVRSEEASHYMEWNHLAVTYGGGVAKIYLNGVLQAANAAMGINPTSVGATNMNYLGKSRFSNPYFHGVFNHFSIVNRILSDAEIVQLKDLTNYH